MLDLATTDHKDQNPVPAKLSALVSGIDVCYAMELAILGMVSERPVMINFDTHRDEGITADAGWWKSDGIGKTAKMLYEKYWYRFPVIGKYRLTKAAEFFWNKYIEPIMNYTMALRKYDDVDIPKDIRQTVDIVYNILEVTPMYALRPTEATLAIDDISRCILMAADYLREYMRGMLMGEIRHSHMGEILEAKMTEAAKTHLEVVILNEPYFRVNLYNVVRSSPYDDLKWVCFYPGDGDQPTVMAYLRTPFNTAHYPNFLKGCEKNPHCQSYDADVGIALVDEFNNVGKFMHFFQSAQGDMPASAGPIDTSLMLPRKD